MRNLFLFLLIANTCFSQKNNTVAKPTERPKLVVGLVVDQMRWDFLYRYYDKYSPNGGFRRLINKGFSCENTYINYMPTYTACGHTCLYTGSVPAIHGITGNNWYDTISKRGYYCTEDKSVSGVGNNSEEGQMSPKNMLVTSICDELKIGTEFKSKVVGVSIKDRGAILPAGHSADAAYWFDGKAGKFISSTYYMKELPVWVNKFNEKKYLSGEGLSMTPMGNTAIKDFGIDAINNEGLGKDSITDFLAMSFSTPDYVGHAYGPNSPEIENIYLKLDKDLEEFFAFLDNKIGRGQYLLFLSADHGVAHSTDYSIEHKLPGRPIGMNFEKATDSILKLRFGNHKLAKVWSNNQVFLDYYLIDSLKLDRNEIAKTIVGFLSAQTAVQRVFEFRELMTVPLQENIRRMIVNGYYPSHTGDIQIILKPGYSGASGKGTTHGAWNPYDTHIPLVWYGWNIKPGKTNREVYMTDVAPTLAAMLKIQMPNGCVGTVIEEVMK